MDKHYTIDKYHDSGPGVVVTVEETTITYELDGLKYEDDGETFFMKDEWKITPLASTKVCRIYRGI